MGGIRFGCTSSFKVVQMDRRDIRYEVDRSLRVALVEQNFVIADNRRLVADVVAVIISCVPVGDVVVHLDLAWDFSESVCVAYIVCGRRASMFCRIHF